MSVQIEHLSKTYQSPDSEIQAISNISLDINNGEFISIVGPSGCGKSTLLEITAGLEPPTTGKIIIDGEPIYAATAKVGFMPQKDHLFPWRTIWGNITLGLEINKQCTNERLEHVTALLERYGLSEFTYKLPSQLSGGMRQRCALIRTLATDPSILLLDEPFSALDYQTRLSVSDDINNIIRNERKTAMLVTHDISESIGMSDRVIVLSKRPAVVQRIFDLHELFGLSPLERRSHPKFKDYFNEIWKELNNNAKQTAP